MASAPTPSEKNDQSRDEMALHGPLLRSEKLAAFLAIVYAIDNAGCSPGYGRITREDDRGVDFTFSLPNYAVRDIIAVHPKVLADAESILRATPSPRSEELNRR